MLKETSALSKRWVNIWKSVPVVEFNQFNVLSFDVLRCEEDEDFEGFEEDEDFADFKKDVDFAGFEGFVGRALDSHTSEIHTFHLGCYLFADNYDLIDGWIQTVMKHNVVEIELDLQRVVCDARPHGQPFMLPECLFTSNTLEVLIVNSNWCIYPPRTTGCFPSLKRLHITAYIADGNFSFDQSLFSHCPVLEYLILDLDDVIELKHFDISAPKLKMLNVSVHMSDHLCTLSIYAPKLESLYLRGYVVSNFLEYAESLVRADIIPKYCNPFEWPDFFNRVRAVLR